MAFATVAIQFATALHTITAPSVAHCIGLSSLAAEELAVDVVEEPRVALVGDSASSESCRHREVSKTEKSAKQTIICRHVTNHRGAGASLESNEGTRQTIDNRQQTSRQ